MSAGARATALVAHLKARREWYGRMLELAKEQKRLIQEAPDQLFEFLERKKAVMAELERLAEAAPGVKAEWEEVKKVATPGESAEVEAELAGISAVLAAVVKEEEECRAIAEGARAGASDELRRATDAKRAATAYGKAAQANPRFVDRRE